MKTRRKSNYGEIHVSRTMFNTLPTFSKLQNYFAKPVVAPFRDGNSGPERESSVPEVFHPPMPEPGFEPWNYVTPHPGFL